MSFKRLVVLAAVLTFGLIMLGAYVRLSDAGLGCPDWPGCYGQLTPNHAADQIAAAVQQQGGEHGPVSLPKAWKEMVHRYIASFLGLLMIAIAVLAWRRRDELKQSPWLAFALVGVVCLQGAFGAWTVTLLLKPAIVTGHLVGGMTLLGLLTWLGLRQFPVTTPVCTTACSPLLKGFARVGLLLVACQIILGGWVSTNYAALACSDFPLCHGQLWPAMEFDHAFHLVRELGQTSDGGLLSMDSLTAIHVVHRLGALLVTLVLLTLCVVLWRQAKSKKLALMVFVALAVQVVLGIANVVFQLPLAVAVAHNGGAALLLMTLVLVNYRLACISSAELPKS
jgi:cytochrome c oxidase assembly protein subunit 15